LFFTGSITFKWHNGIATMLMLQAFIMGFTGELIAMWYSADVTNVKSSLLYLKYNTAYGDVLLRMHKLTINVSFALVFVHMSKGITLYAGAGSRAAIWKSGIGILICMYGASYAGCILPWNVLSPTLYTMIQTILDVYAGGAVVLMLLGGERLPALVLEKTLLAHVMVSTLGLIFVLAHIRFIHFNNSSVTKYYTWTREERPHWLPNELVKEVFVFYLYCFFFFYITYRKSMTFGSMIISVFKFYYAGATNWNFLPPSIEPEWYFWIFYFALASSKSLTGGLFRAIFLFIALYFTFSFRDVVNADMVNNLDAEVLNSFFHGAFVLLATIFFTRSKFRPWHTGAFDLILFSLTCVELIIYPININLLEAYSEDYFAKRNKIVV